MSSGGTLAGVTISGGIVEIKNGGAVLGTVVFQTSGTLQLWNSTSFGGAISGLATPTQLVDLMDIAYSSSTTVSYAGDTTSGTLSVSDGIHTANLSLLGNYVTENFKIASDGHGGTFLADPPYDGAPYDPAMAGGLRGAQVNEGDAPELDAYIDWAIDALTGTHSVETALLDSPGFSSSVDWSASTVDEDIARLVEAMVAFAPGPAGPGGGLPNPGAAAVTPEIYPNQARP